MAKKSVETRLAEVERQVAVLEGKIEVMIELLQNQSTPYYYVSPISIPDTESPPWTITCSNQQVEK